MFRLGIPRGFKVSELRAPYRRRKATHERDYLPIVFAIVAITVLAAYGTGKYQKHLADAEAAIIRENQLLQAQAAERRRRAEEQQSLTAVPTQRYQAPPEKSVMQRQAEALAILQGSSASTYSNIQSQQGSYVLSSAERECDSYRNGSIDYRRCRADVSRRLIDTCRRLNNEEKYVKASMLDAHRQQRRLYCDAKDRYKIID